LRNGDIIMVRTIISLDEDDKAWLDARARALGVPMTALIRTAVRMLRSQPAGEPTTAELIDQTRGVWREGDGLDYQERLRDEWR
jgi:hypothetical protein